MSIKKRRLLLLKDASMGTDGYSSLLDQWSVQGWDDMSPLRRRAVELLMNGEKIPRVRRMN